MLTFSENVNQIAFVRIERKERLAHTNNSPTYITFKRLVSQRSAIHSIWIAVVGRRRADKTLSSSAQNFHAPENGSGKRNLRCLIHSIRERLRFNFEIISSHKSSGGKWIRIRVGFDS